MWMCKCKCECGCVSVCVSVDVWPDDVFCLPIQAPEHGRCDWSVRAAGGELVGVAERGG